MNKIIEEIIIRKNGNYCHALEIVTVYELECIIAQLTSDFISEGYNKDEIIEFFDTISIYALDDLEEQEIYDFNITNYINELMED